MKASVTLYFIRRFHLIQETSFLAMIPIHLIILIEGEKKIYMPCSEDKKLKVNTIHN